MLAQPESLEVVADVEPGDDFPGHVGNHHPELVVADFQGAFGEKGEAALHAVQRVGQVALGLLARIFGDLELVAGPAERIKRLFQVPRLFPDLSLQGDCRLEQGIGAVADIVFPAGTLHERRYDFFLAPDLVFKGFARVDQNRVSSFGGKNATPTNVWFT